MDTKGRLPGMTGPTPEQLQQGLPTETQVVGKVREVTGATGLGFNDIFGRAYYTDLLKRAGWRWVKCVRCACNTINSTGVAPSPIGDIKPCPDCSGKGGKFERIK